ncbi:hypothetical protein [Streptomyces avidinii]
MSEVAAFLIILCVTVVGWGVIYLVARRQTYGSSRPAGRANGRDSGGGDGGGGCGGGDGCGSGGGCGGD